MVESLKPKIPSTLTIAETIFAMVMVMFVPMGIFGFIETGKIGQSLLTIAMPVGYFYIRYYSGWV